MATWRPQDIPDDMLGRCTRDHHYPVSEELVAEVDECRMPYGTNIVAAVVVSATNGRPQYYFWPMDLGQREH